MPAGWRPAAGLCTVVIAGLCLLASATPSGASEPADLVLIPSEGGAPELLVPGSSSGWELGITTRAVRVDSLTVAWSASGPLAGTVSGPGSESLVTVSVESCTDAWLAGRCVEGSHLVVAPVAIGELATDQMHLRSPDGTVPQGAHLRVVASLAATAPQSVAGLTVVVRADVAATGEASGDVASVAGGAPATGLADTGMRVAGFAALGALAVAAGLLLARGARGGRPFASGAGGVS